MKTALKVAALTIATTLFYAYVGNLVPQKETYPPEDVEVRSDMSTDEMIAAGKEIVEGKGTCLSCHTIGAQEAGRFPDLGGIGLRAASRREGLSDVEYLAESLYDPNAYIVDGFNPGMIAASKPPISLNDQEILTVIAYLQSLGGTPSVTMSTELSFQGAAPEPTESAPAGGAPAGEAVAAVPSGLDGATLMQNYACVTCHNLDGPGPLVGPSLYDVGSRMTVAQIYESIMEPDATLAEGFPGVVMSATLEGMGFYDKLSTSDLKTIVTYLSEHKGDQ